MKNKNYDTNLCDSCENVMFLTKKDSAGTEVRSYKCLCSECHSYCITECPHYSNPNGFQRFLRNKVAVTFISLIIIAAIIAAIVIFA